MKFEPTITVDELEERYFKFQNVTQFELPNSFKKNQIGLISSAIQFFITVSKAGSPKIIFYDYDCENDHEDDLKKIISDPICLAIILMFNEIYDSKGVEFKRRINKDIVSRLDENIYFSGHRIQMLAVDHSIEKYAYPNCFYDWSGERTMQGASYYTYLLSDFFKERIKSANVNSSELSTLGSFISELIDNTEQHGKFEFTTGKQNRSIRGMVLNYHMVKKNDNIESMSGNLISILDYIQRSKQENRALHLLEISIFDSGVGIYESFGGVDSEVGTEKEVVSKSFLKGVTSKKNGLGYGRGLNNVRQTLNQRGGLIKIRSGSVSLYRDYNLEHLNDENTDVMFFEEGSGDGTGTANVSGVAYTILVPVK
ncbi:MAG: hypothetical protein ACI978_000299 [Oleispira sp.]|jgi:hypothetical protein